MWGYTFILHLKTGKLFYDTEVQEQWLNLGRGRQCLEGGWKGLQGGKQ